MHTHQSYLVVRERPGLAVHQHSSLLSSICTSFNQVQRHDEVIATMAEAGTQQNADLNEQYRA